MKKIPGIDSHVIVKDNYECMIELRRLCMVQEGTTIHHGSGGHDHTLPATMCTPHSLTKTIKKLTLLAKFRKNGPKQYLLSKNHLSSAQSVVYALWKEVPKLVYYRLICKPVECSTTCTCKQG